MIGARWKPRRTLSITSLIDVIFLLLLFFMLASTFQRYAEVEVGGVAASGAGATTAGVEVTRLVVGPDTIVLNGASLGDAQALARVSSGADGSRPVNLEVTPDASSQRLLDVLVMLRPVPGLDVNLVAPK